MRRGPDSLNRGVLTLVSLVLIGGGAYGLARGYEAFGSDAAAEPLLVDSVRRWVGDNENWFWPVVALVGVTVSLLSLRWLLAQFRFPRIGELDLTREGSLGTTRLRASGAAGALADDVESYLGVRSASARIVDDGECPDVDLRVEVHDDADVAALRSRIEEHALPRFSRALEVEAVEARVHLQLVGPGERVVR